MANERWLAVLVVLAATGARAADESWVGRVVVAKRAGVAFGYAEGGKWVDAGEVAELAVTVLERRGDWVLVRSGGRRGWARAAEFVTLADAPAYFTALVEARPGDPSNYLRRAAAWAERGEYARADGDCGEAVRLDSASAAARYARAVARHLGGSYAGALADYDAAVRLDPGHAGALGGRAWLRATCPDGRFRDGAAAVRDARRACELTGWAEAECLDTLAAACAEAGRFEEAVRFQSKALEVPGLRSPGREGAVARVKLYKEGKPYRTAGRD